MKVTNWRRKIVAAIVAAGIYVPGVAHAVNIPVLDQDFETYSVPSWNYAYATGPKGAYRPASAWVDDLGHNSGNYFEDNASSNYLYNTTYANAYGRGTPRSARRGRRRRCEDDRRAASGREHRRRRGRAPSRRRDRRA